MVRHCLWKMSATPGACIKPRLVRRPLCHKGNLPSCVARRPLCYEVNLRSCQAGQRYLILTCDIFGTGKTNTLTLSLCLMEFCKVTLTFESMDEILWYDHSNETSLPALTQNEIWKFGRNLLLAKFGSERVNSMLFIRKWTYKPAQSSASLESLKSKRSTKLLEKLLKWTAHTFNWRLWQG